MSKVEIEFNNKKETEIELPLWLVDGEELYQVIPVNKGYILFDHIEVDTNPAYIIYDSIQDVIEDNPDLKIVNVKIIVS